ncbi:S-layer homology domain-containing protein [Lysinibacillus piscis]|uniref:SLH domain-containing protein n=1 Tax=Lysinibacillus piscis TaxID=2518931 RepID=A0ABQ5NHT5_9BACI|nr:S-layer homology domain-containing protein [Lysinibacillus sp. KH24]GLC87863.1 hypothetical protein LYSBPC_09900 [Lysinibacillus sp. KH24]
MRKNAWALAMIAVTVPFVAAIPTTAATMPFSDIHNSGNEVELYQAVNDLYQEGIVFGTTVTTFSPYQSLTRGEAAYFLAKALHLDTEQIANPGYMDVPTTHPYYKHIAALAVKGIIQQGANYYPSKPITRSQMAKILTKGFEWELVTSNEKTFSDFTKDSETNQYIQTLLYYRVTQGTSATTFSPYANVQRGQMALFLHRALQTQMYIVSVE